MNGIKRYIPNYCYHTPMDLTVHEFSSLEELLGISWVSRYPLMEDYRGLFVSDPWNGDDRYVLSVAIFCKRSNEVWYSTIGYLSNLDYLESLPSRQRVKLGNNVATGNHWL